MDYTDQERAGSAPEENGGDEVGVRDIPGIDGNNIVLCGASSYTQKYFLNPVFAKLPQGVKDDLKIMCVTFTSEIGGELLLEFTPQGDLEFRTAVSEHDFLYDDIGSGLKVHQIQKDRRDLLEALETYYKVAVLGEPLPEEYADGGRSETDGTEEDAGEGGGKA